VMHAQLVLRMREFVELQPATLVLMRLGYQAWINKVAPKAWLRRTFWPRPVVRW
jgi:hypothetical protein